MERGQGGTELSLILCLFRIKPGVALLEMSCREGATQVPVIYCLNKTDCGYGRVAAARERTDEAPRLTTRALPFL